MGQSHVQFHVMFQDPNKIHLLENIPYNATRHEFRICRKVVVAFVFVADIGSAFEVLHTYEAEKALKLWSSSLTS